MATNSGHAPGTAVLSRDDTRSGRVSLAGFRRGSSGGSVVAPIRPDPAEVRVVLADSHPVVRGGMRVLLGSVVGVTVVAEAGTGHAAVREAVLHRPHVLIMDLRMGEFTTTIAEVRRAAPSTAVLVFTMADDDESVFAAMRAGARGYLLKRAERDDIVRAIRGVAAGGAVFGSPIAERLSTLFDQSPPARNPFPELTTREREVLELLAAGLPNSAIARRLDLARKTVSNHLSAIFAKLAVPSRAEAIVLAREAGLGP